VSVSEHQISEFFYKKVLSGFSRQSLEQVPGQSPEQKTQTKNRSLTVVRLLVF
jgi:hypothetical protein